MGESSQKLAKKMLDFQIQWGQWHKNMVNQIFNINGKNNIDLTIQQFIILMLIHKMDINSVSQIAYLLNLSKSSISLTLSKMEKEDLLKQRRYVFLYRDRAGVPKGFFIYRKKSTPDGVVMECTTTFEARNDFLFLDADAFSEMLSFIRSAFGSYYDKIHFAIPADISLSLLLGEDIKSSCEKYYGGMSRVIDVKKALKMCRCLGSGQLCIGIKDDILPENQGVWKIRFSEGQENQVEKVSADIEEAVDLLLPINEFSALICGDKGAEDIRWMPNVKVYSKEEEEIGKIFYHKKCFMTELF